MFAIDYPLDWGDDVYCPFWSGTVTFAGRNTAHINYGIFVVIQDDGGEYVNMSGHLSELPDWVVPGAAVTHEDVIGYAGDTGDPGGTIPVVPPHLHSAFYRNPSFLDDGSPFGGQGLQVTNHHYVGTAACTGPGVYQVGRDSQGNAISN